MPFHPQSANAAPDETLAIPAAANVTPSDALCTRLAPAARIDADVLVPAVTSNDVLATSDVDATKHMFQPTPKSPCPQTKCANVVPERMIPDDAAMTAAPAMDVISNPNRATAAPVKNDGAYIPTMCVMMTCETRGREYPSARIARGVGLIRKDMAA